MRELALCTLLHKNTRKYMRDLALCTLLHKNTRKYVRIDFTPS